MGERLVDVYRAFNEAEAYIIKGKLEESGIPCVIKSNTSSSVYVFTMNGMGEIKIYVPESMADKALQLIEEVSQVPPDGEDAPEG